MRRTALALLVVPSFLLAQDREPNDLAVIGRIKTEAFEHSRVMDTLGYLTDINGPRLTASPGFKQAADWAVKRLQSYGVVNIQQEKWGPFGRSWNLKQASAEVVEPGYSPLDASPLAWSDSTPGPVSGEVIAAPYAAASQDPKKIEEGLKKYMAEWKGKLKGRVVLVTPKTTIRPEIQPSFLRYTDRELADLAAAPAPVAKLFEVPDFKDLTFPEDAEQARQFQASLPSWVTDALAKQRTELNARRTKFLRDEGVV